MYIYFKVNKIYYILKIFHLKNIKFQSYQTDDINCHVSRDEVCGEQRGQHRVKKDGSQE